MKLFTFTAILFTFLTTTAEAKRSRAVNELACKHISPINMSYLNRHVNYSKETKNLESRTINQFIKKLDGSKIYLLKKDISKIKTSMKNVFSKMRGRDCTSIKQAHKLFIQRVTDRVNFAKKYLGPQFKFNKNTKLILDPDKRQYPLSMVQANNFHKKYIQFQISNYLATDMKLAEARENVIKNYKRVLRRVKDFEKKDLWAFYINAFAHSLDPHSSYLSQEDLEDFEIQMKLSLEGIGATLSSPDGFTVIEQLIPGGAAFKSGKLKPKDKIVAVAQGGLDSSKKAPKEQASKLKFENVIEMALRDVVRKIRGKKGTKVTLTILRKEGKRTHRFNVTLVRDKIKLEDEAAAITYHSRKVQGVTKKIGLINLPSFYADSRRKGKSAAKDVKKLLQQARYEKIDGLVLDLSTNGGGSLEDAVKISGLFFKTGNVVKQSHRDPRRGEVELADKDPMVDYQGPLVVLISRVSASASEIVAGALKDYKRAVVVGGDHTFGKGTVQSVEPLPPGLGAVKTTVGMFFTVGGYSTQHRGVAADITLPSAFSNNEIGERTLDYSLPPKRIKPFLSKEAYGTDSKTIWKTVSKKLIRQLKVKSKARVVKSKEFKKIISNIEKSEKRGKMIHVGELMDQKDEEDKDNKKGKDKNKVLTREEKKEKYLERPDINEALNIAVDMIGYMYKTGITIGAKSLKKPDSSKAKKNN